MNIWMKPGIPEYRIKLGMTKRLFAITAGISPELYGQIELGKVGPSPATAKKIINALGLPFEQVFDIVKKEKGDEGNGN